MKRGWKIALGAGGVVLAAGGYFAYGLMRDAGVFTEIAAGFGGTCTQVRWAGPGSDEATRPRLVGVEDLLIDSELGVAFFSAEDRRASMTQRETRGAILVARLADLEGSMREATDEASGAPRPFHPHGIGYFKDAAGRRTLMVVNHPDMARDMADTDKQHAIEIFDVLFEVDVDGHASVTLRHRQTVTSPVFTSINDVAPLDHDTFFATIDVGSTSSLGRTLETFGRLPRAGVVFWDTREARIVIPDLTYANSVAVTPDLSRLYVTETTGRRFSSWDISADPAAPRMVSEIAIPSALDNIDIAADGRVWVAAHPKMFDFLAHAGDASAHSPSQILALNVNAAGGGDVTQIYLNPGEELSGSSVAAVHRKQMLVGSVFEEKILNCLLP